MANPDYSTWPTIANVYALLTGANITPGLASSSLVAQGFLDEAIGLMGQLTKRQFVAGSAGEIRYFDGSGTGVQTVTEFVDVPAVQFLLYPQVAGIDIQYWYEQSRNQYPNTTLQIYQGPANTNYGYVANFPQGRSNIKVTGTWGYASTIPYAVWMAVLKGAAASIATMNSLTSQGKLAKWVDGDASEDYGGSANFGEFTGWAKEFYSTVKAYKRPEAERRKFKTAALY